MRWRSSMSTRFDPHRRLRPIWRGVCCAAALLLALRVGEPALAQSEVDLQLVLAVEEAVAADVTINGLPILAVEPLLDRCYRDYVIGGPGAFMVVAESFEHFADAILKKMIIEIAANERAPSRSDLPNWNGTVAKAER